MQELQFNMRRVNDVEVIEMTGAVDAMAFTGFSATLTRMMEEVTPCIVLECSRVSYIGSAQLKELIDFAHLAQSRGGDVKCVGLPQTIQQVANLIAMLIQYLSAKLGIVTGRNLAEMCREQFAPPVVIAMWIASEVAAMATDLAEFLGGAIGLSILFHIPLLAGMVVTAVQAFINMGVAVSLLPAKGMTLLFISYGGSSLFSIALTMGFALAVTRQRPKLTARAESLLGALGVHA